MLDTREQFGFFQSQHRTHNQTVVSHIIIPASVEHRYENSNQSKALRNALYIKSYESNGSDQNPVVFFHGGPEIVNQEQFSIMQSYFTQRGHTFYIPEIEGSAMYARAGMLPTGFEPGLIPPGLKLLELQQLGGTGLNEFTRNYADDIKDVLDEISRRHPDKKIDVITHSLGGHHLLRSLQHYPDLSQKINGICNVAGTVDIGANRFINTLKNTPRSIFELRLEIESIRFVKSCANENQDGPRIDRNSNPSVDQHMNGQLSVLYGNTTCFPPILFLHATDDQNVFFQGSLSLQQKMQQNGCIAHGLYFSSGGHQFIKNEGDPEVRVRALEAMEDFFNSLRKNRV